MTRYLQRLIDKYRTPVGFEEYMKRQGRDRESELKAVRICVITPRKMTGSLSERMATSNVYNDKSW